MNRPLRIVQVNASETGGGAEAIARQLHRGYRSRGHDATLLVGRGSASESGVRAFPTDWRTRVLHGLAGPLRIADRRRGRETFHYPATRSMLAALDPATDILHLHNLHGGYFDLRALPQLSAAVPTALTLHDAWLLSGHCAHSLECERWRTGCGACPHLDIYPAVAVDDTAANWRRKQEIFARTRLHVAAPSRWLAQRAEQSMLAAAAVAVSVLPNGVDTSTFSPGDRRAARRALGLDADAPLLLFVGSNARSNPFKDLRTAERAAAVAADRLEQDLTLLVLGDDAQAGQAGRARIRFAPFQHDAAWLALHYRAADLLVHAAHADTFPSTILEALACGTPVIATAVGGIPEQVDSTTASGRGEWSAAAPEEATGTLVPHADAAAMAAAIVALLTDGALRSRLGRNAARIAAERFDAERQCDAYIDWYRAILDQRAHPAVSADRHARADRG
jgi:glycosyltransferase involved in cell wall biosynthesis